MDTEFYRLPLRFDAARLLEESSRFAGYEWKPDDRFESSGYRSLCLVSHRGWDGDLQEGPMQPSPHLRRCPYTRQALAALGSPLGEVRFRWLESGAEVPPHYDNHPACLHRIRFHVPLRTDPTVRFLCGPRDVHMGEGELWTFDRQRLHRVVNRHAEPRVHLVIDVERSGRIDRLLQRAERPFAPEQTPAAPRLVEYDARLRAQPRADGTATPPVLPPGAVDELMACVLERVDAETKPGATAREKLERALRELRSAWAAAWRRFGPESDALGRYQALGREATAAVEALEARVPALRRLEVLSSKRLRDFFQWAITPYQPWPGDEASMRERLVTSLLLRVTERGALELRWPGARAFRRVTPEAVALLSALAATGKESLARELAGSDAPAASSLIRALRSARVLLPFHVEGGPGVAAPGTVSASPRRAQPRSTVRAPRAIRLVEPLHVRMSLRGDTAIWVPSSGGYRVLSSRALRLTCALASGATRSEAAAQLGVANDAALARFVALLIELGLARAA
jgi:hypothetical protein